MADPKAPAPALRLFHYWRSSTSWRVRWALTLKGLACEYVPVSLLDGEVESSAHRARNPLGYVPVLERLGETDPKRRFLTESLAILEWLEETHPDAALLPRDPLSRLRARQLAEIINSGTQPVHNPAVSQLHSEDPAEQKRWTQHWMHNGFAAYEHWARDSAGRFSVGDEVSIADICLVPQCYNAARFEVSLDAYPTVKRVAQAARATDAAEQSSPERFQPDLKT
jgi:maleylacetoacetate isomerase